MKSRREFLHKAGLGIGALGVSSLALPGGGLLSYANAADLAAGIDDPLAPKKPHFPGKAKSVIWLHMDGAPSHLDLFDYKPELIRLAGTPTPDSFTQGIQLATRAVTPTSSSSPSGNGSSTGRAGPGSPTCCRTWPSVLTTSPSSSPA